MTSSGDESLRHGPGGLSMSPGERRGRVRRTKVTGAQGAVC